MSLIGKIIRLKESSGFNGDINISSEGQDFLVLDKVNATHHNNAGDDVFIVSSIKTGLIKILSPTYLINAKVMPGEEQK